VAVTDPLEAFKIKAAPFKAMGVVLPIEPAVEVRVMVVPSTPFVLAV
jgi:hypothetical protein